MSLLSETITLYPQVVTLIQQQPPSVAPAVLTAPSESITYDLSTLLTTDFSDRTGYVQQTQHLLDETKALQQLQQHLHTGHSVHLPTLYTYRACSKALPMIKGDESDDAKQRVHTLTFAILRPEILKMKEMLTFHESVVAVLKAALPLLTRDAGRKESGAGVVSEALMEYILRTLDMLIIMDALKDMKASLLNDFSRYKRSFTPIRSTLADAESLSTEIHFLQLFLSNPQCSHNLILFHLKTDVQQIANYDYLLVLLMNYALDCIDTQRYLLPAEYHMYHRVLPYILYLLDSDDKKGMNAFRYNGKVKFDMNKVQKVVKTLPILPLYNDMHLDVIFVLKRCAHWEDNMSSEWITAKPQKVMIKYSLTAHRVKIRKEYLDAITLYMSISAQINTHITGNRPIPAVLLQSFYNALLTNLRLLSQWNAKIQECNAYKYAKPVSNEQYAAIKAKEQGEAGAGGVGAAPHPPSTPNSASKTEGSEYEKAIKYNYSAEDLYALLDIMGMVKGLAGKLTQDSDIIDICLRRYIHDDVESFLLGDVVSEPMRKAYKHKRQYLLSLMQSMRDIAADWIDQNKQVNAYQNKKESTTTDNIISLAKAGTDYPRRAVAHTPIQLYFLRRLLHSMFDERSSGMQGGMFTERDLKKETVDQWSLFYSKSYYYTYLLNFTSILRQVQDCSFLWYREFYLEITKCIQFPISMSLPWLLCQFLIFSPLSAMKENVFYPLDIYNDAANVSLTHYKQQFLYDEIEAECSLSFIQLTYHMSHELIKLYKNFASNILINKNYEKRYREYRESLIKNKTERTAEEQRLRYETVETRYVSVMSQRSIVVLGRSVDIHTMFTQQVNTQLRNILDVIIRRFEASDMTAIAELSMALKHFQLMHSLLKKHLIGIDTYDMMWCELNEDSNLGSFRGRIIMHFYNELINDLLPNFIFNDSTQRFVRSRKSFSVNTIERGRMPRECVSGNGCHYIYGKKYSLFYDKLGQSQRFYFGQEHLEALTHVIPFNDIPLIVHELIKEMELKFEYDFNPYAIALVTGLPLLKPPPIAYGIVGIYGYFDVKLRTSLGVYEPLRPSVFHQMREMGNALLFLRQMESVLDIHNHFNFLITAHFWKIRGWKGKDRMEQAQPYYIPAQDTVPPYVATLREASKTINNPAMTNILSLAEESSNMYQYRADENMSMFSYAISRLASKISSVRHSWYDAQGVTHDMTRLISLFLFILSQPIDDPRVVKHIDANLGQDYAIFGDGMILFMTVLLQVLNERSRFELIDVCGYIERMERVLPIDRQKLMTKKNDSLKNKKIVLNEQENQELIIIDWFRNMKLIKERFKAIFASLQTFYPEVERTCEPVAAPRVGAVAGSGSNSYQDNNGTEGRAPPMRI